MNKLTLKQNIEVIHKCADSIISDDNVVQTALHESANEIEERLDIWKDPKVELPKEESFIIGYSVIYGIIPLYCEYYDEDGEDVCKGFSSIELDKKFLKCVKKWCYESNLIKQAKGAR